MEAARTILLAGPPGPGLDYLRATLRRNRGALGRLGVAIARARPGAASDAPEAARSVLVLDAARTPRAAALAALRDALTGPAPRVIAYVDPPEAAIAARVERALLDGRPLARQLARARPLGYRAALAPLEATFGAETLSIRLSGPAHLPGDAIVEDFWRAARLPGSPAATDRPAPPAALSLEGALALDRVLVNHPAVADRTRDPRAAAAALACARRIAGRPFAPPRDHVAAVLEASRDDIAWLAARLDAPLGEPRRKTPEPAWAMDADTLDSLAALIARAARQASELAALRRRTRGAAQGR